MIFMSRLHEMKTGKLKKTENSFKYSRGNKKNFFESLKDWIKGR